MYNTPSELHHRLYVGHDLRMVHHAPRSTAKKSRSPEDEKSMWYSQEPYHTYVLSAGEGLPADDGGLIHGGENYSAPPPATKLNHRTRLPAPQRSSSHPCPSHRTHAHSPTRASSIDSSSQSSLSRMETYVGRRPNASIPRDIREDDDGEHVLAIEATDLTSGTVFFDDDDPLPSSASERHLHVRDSSISMQTTNTTTTNATITHFYASSPNILPLPSPSLSTTSSSSFDGLPYDDPSASPRLHDSALPSPTGEIMSIMRTRKDRRRKRESSMYLPSFTQPSFHSADPILTPITEDHPASATNSTREASLHISPSPVQSSQLLPESRRSSATLTLSHFGSIQEDESVLRVSRISRQDSTVSEIPATTKLTTTVTKKPPRTRPPPLKLVGKSNSIRQRRVSRRQSRASTIATPLSPALSTVSTIAAVMAGRSRRRVSERELRRRRFNKLMRTLGEEVPRDLIDNTIGAAGARGVSTTAEIHDRVLAGAGTRDIGIGKVHVAGIRTNLVPITRHGSSSPTPERLGTPPNTGRVPSDSRYAKVAPIVTTTYSSTSHPQYPARRGSPVISPVTPESAVPYFENHPFRVVVEDTDAGPQYPSSSLSGTFNPLIEDGKAQRESIHPRRDELPWMRASLAVPVSFDKPFFQYGLLKGVEEEGLYSQNLSVRSITPTRELDQRGVYRKEKRQGWSGEWNQPHIQDVIHKLRQL